MVGLARDLPSNGQPARGPTPAEQAANAAAQRALNAGVAGGQIETSEAVTAAVHEQGTGYRYGRERDNLSALRIARVDAYDELIDEIQRTTGERLANPMDERFSDPLSAPYLQDRYGTVLNDPVARFEYRLAMMGENRPELAPFVARANRSAIERRADEIRRNATARFQEYIAGGGSDGFDQFMRGLSLTPGLIVGAMSTGSPEQIGQLAAGGAGRGMNLLERVVAGAATNTAAQAFVEPAVLEDARRMGEEHGPAQVALDFATAGILGGLLEGAGGGHAPEAAPGFGRRESTLRETTALTVPESVALYDEPGSGSAVQRTIMAGRGEALITSAHQRDRVTTLDLPDNPGWHMAAVDEINANDRFVRGEDEIPASSQPQPKPLDARELEALRRQADDAPAPDAGTREMVAMNGRSRPRTFERFAPDALGFDPGTFQYKRSEGPQGSTGRLQGVGAWDSQSAGKLVVWESADGQRIVADGHQRAALAQSLQAGGQDIKLDGYLYREKDGWSAQEVRNIAAQKNLRETTGDVFDTAGLMRDAPDLIDNSIPQGGAEFRTARGLAKLSDEAYRAVRAGEVNPRIGAVIGEIAADRPEVHEGLVQWFHRNPPANVQEAALVTREATMAHTQRMISAQMSLFGDDLVIAGMQERATILVNAAQILRDDKRLFSMAERNRAALEEAGNVLAADANARRAQMAAAMVREIDALATRPGPVSAALREITDRASANKTSAKVAAREFVDTVQRLLDERGLIGLKQDADQPPPAPPIPETIEPMAQRLEQGARSAELREAHDMDEEAIAQSMAEVALERAMRGELGDVIPEDAIGNTPEADLARIEDAAEALGIDADFTEMQVAAAIYARPDAAMEAEARARLMPPKEEPATPTEGADVPDAATFADAAEHNAAIDPPFRLADFEDVESLDEAVAKATLPELEAVARAEGLGGESRTRAEYGAMFARDVAPPDAGSTGAGRAPPFEFGANEFSSRMVFPRDVPPGPATVHATSLTPTFMQPGNTRFGNSGTKFVTVNGEPVARAEITQAAEGGPVTVQLIQTIEGARRRGYARQLLDDLYSEFGPFRTTAQSKDGSALFANYVRQADGTYVPAAPDGSSATFDMAARREELMQPVRDLDRIADELKDCK